MLNKFNYISSNENHTMDLGRNFAKKLKKGNVIGFSGDLGSGKTTFIKGIMDGLNYKNIVTSPTFTLINEYDAFIALGCVIKGQTPHFEYIASSVAHGIMTACQETGIPITFGVLTTNTEDEALAGSGDGTSTKGREAALSAVRVANIVATIGK